MLTDKVVVIAGGAGVIGRAFVSAIIENGGKAIIADVDPAHGIEVAEILQDQLQTKCIDFIELDITSKQSLIHAISLLRKRYTVIDAFVNSAYPKGPNYGRPFFEVEYEDFIENISINLGGFFVAAQQFAEFFKCQGHGNIINVASIYGVVAPKFEIYNKTGMTMPVEYAAIKAGQIHMVRYMAKLFKKMNIRINTLSPGGVLDGQDSIFTMSYGEECLNKGMLDSGDLKGTLVYLLSDLSKYVNGQNIIVDDGFTL